MPVFPTTPQLDDFQRVDQAPVGGPWQLIAPSTTQNGLQVLNHLCSSPFTNQGNVAWDHAAIADQECWASIHTVPASGHACGVLVRVRDISLSVTTWDGYAFRWIPSSGEYHLDRMTNGFVGANLQSTAGSLTAGDRIGISAIGSTIRGYQYTAGAWQQIGSDVTDANYANGLPGLYQVNTSGKFDFAGGGVQGTLVFGLLPILMVGT